MIKNEIERKIETLVPKKGIYGTETLLSESDDKLYLANKGNGT